MAGPGEANQRWGEMLSRWAIPQDLIDAAPQPPYFFDPQVFIGAADEATVRSDDTPSDAAARQALPPGGSVLDVGCGAGAASLRLGPSQLTGVDPSPALLQAFAERASRLGIAAATINGVWPDTETETPNADVVVCHHVFYNVADLAPFAAALTSHARVRVIVELTAAHPMGWLAPYWKALHQLDQPDRPTADDAIAVLDELGYLVHQRRWQRDYPMIGEGGAQATARIARRLCLPESRHNELEELLAATPPPAHRDVVTLWW